MKRFFLFFISLFLLCNCATTRLHKEGEYFLTKNEIIFEQKDNNLEEKSLLPYIKQSANSYLIGTWSPRLDLYTLAGENNNFLNKIFRKLGKKPIIFKRDLVSQSEIAIKNHLDYLGYYNSNVSSQIICNKNNAKVIYKINLGKTYTINKVIYTNLKNKEFEDDLALALKDVKITKGSHLSEHLLDQEASKIAQNLNNLSYFDFTKYNIKFVADTLAENGTADLSIRIDSVAQVRYTFRKVEITYPASFQISNKLLKSYNRLRPNTFYSDKSVKNTYNRFASLKTFSNVNIDLQKVDSNMVDCSINLSPAATQSMKFNFEVSGNSTKHISITPKLAYIHKNIFGGAQWLSLEGSANWQFKSNLKNIKVQEYLASVSINFPKPLFLPMSWFAQGLLPNTEVQFTYNYQRRPEYHRRGLSSSFIYKGTYNKHFYYSFSPLNISLVHVPQIDSQFQNLLNRNPWVRNAYQERFDLGTNIMLLYTNTLDPLPKKSYWRFRFDFDLYGNSLSAFNHYLPKDKDGHHSLFSLVYSQFVRSEFNLTRTWMWGNNDFAIASRFVAGFAHAYGNSVAVPFDKQFFTGGSSSMRGWHVRELGPGAEPTNTDFVIPSQTGNFKLESNLEFRFRLYKALHFASFVDIGNVWNLLVKNSDPITHFSLNTLAANWGAGFRLDLKVLLLRFDLGIKMFDPSRPEGHKWISPSQSFHKDNYSFHFAVGYPF